MKVHSRGYLDSDAISRVLLFALEPSSCMFGPATVAANQPLQTEMEKIILVTFVS